MVSYHEVGHALTSALQKDAEPVQKITIIPRTSGALAVLQTPEEEKFLLSKKEILARLVVCMGGRAAEVVFDSVTTGASNDIQQATNLASHGDPVWYVREVRSYGTGTRESMYLDNGSVLNCSDETASHVDEEVMRILKEAMRKQNVCSQRTVSVWIRSLHS